MLKSGQWEPVHVSPQSSSNFLGAVIQQSDLYLHILPWDPGQDCRRQGQTMKGMLFHIFMQPSDQRSRGEGRGQGPKNLKGKAVDILEALVKQEVETECLLTLAFPSFHSL